MPEKIYKLQPNRTLALRGFDDLGASAALHSATASSFKVSGAFRDAADFAVLVLHDAYNFFEHPRLKHLPDFDFDGLTLQFDVHYTGLMPLDSPKFETISWPFLDVIREDGSILQKTPEKDDRIRLFDHATQIGGTYTKAGGSFTIVNNGLKQADTVTLWYLNHAFEYAVPAVEGVVGPFNGSGGPGSLHWVDVDGVRYQTTQVEGDTNTSITARLVAALAAAPKVTAAQSGPGNQIDLRNRADDGSEYSVSSSGGGGATLHGIGANTVAARLASIINNYNNYGGTLFRLTATSTGATVNILAARPGVDGNFVTMYATSKNGRLTTAQSTVQFTGGSSDATWRVTLDFATLSVPKIRQMWLTFAPPLQYGAAIPATEWEATFTNWTLTAPLGLESKRELQVAGPDSVRVEEDDPWCSYSDLNRWPVEEGFFSGGFARRASRLGDHLTVKYACAVTHDLYIGTSLHWNHATAGIRLDGDSETDLDCAFGFLPPDPIVPIPAVIGRRIVRSNVPPGEHTVTIHLKTDHKFFDFDFLEAAAVGDVPDALPAISTMSPALDYSTDHTYKLSPARILWNFDKLGFAAPLNVYLGVFWWNQRIRIDDHVPSTTVTFSGDFVAGDAAFVRIGAGTAELGKSVVAGEGPAQIAKHFEYMINAMLVGVYATASGNTLHLTSRSPKPNFGFEIEAHVEQVAGSTGTATANGDLLNGDWGRWAVDPSQGPLNRGARAWLADLFNECKARDREVTIASSMELVNPPDDFPARYANQMPVETDVGFGFLKSTHCAFSTPMLTLHKALFIELASMMSAALLTPNLQLGEFVWWFFSKFGSMGYYDQETRDAALEALDRQLHVFEQPTDDPNVNGGADATFLRNRLRDYASAIINHVKATYPAAKFELLFPYDVNHPMPVGVHNLGGALNRFVNFPVEWQAKATSGFDRLKMEALNFGAWSRNLTLCRTAIEFPLALDWPLDSIRYLAPVFRAKAAWEKEYLLAKGVKIPIINFWAFDHVCLFGLNPREPQNHSRAITE